MEKFRGSGQTPQWSLVSRPAGCWSLWLGPSCRDVHGAIASGSLAGHCWSLHQLPLLWSQCIQAMASKPKNFFLKNTLFISFIYFYVGFLQFCGVFLSFLFFLLFFLFFSCCIYSYIYINLFYILLCNFVFLFSILLCFLFFLSSSCLLLYFALFVGCPLGPLLWFCSPVCVLVSLVFKWLMWFFIFFVQWVTLLYFLFFGLLVLFVCVPLFLLLFLWFCTYHLSWKHGDPKLLGCSKSSSKREDY